MPSLLGQEGGAGGILRLRRAAESKVKQFGRQNIFFFNLILYWQQILNYWIDYKEIR